MKNTLLILTIILLSACNTLRQHPVGDTASTALDLNQPLTHGYRPPRCINQ